MKVQPLSVPPFVQLVPWLSFTRKLTTVLKQLHDTPSNTKAAGRLFLSIAISKQLNAVPYTYGISLGNYYGEETVANP